MNDAEAGRNSGVEVVKVNEGEEAIGRTRLSRAGLGDGRGGWAGERLTCAGL